MRMLAPPPKQYDAQGHRPVSQIHQKKKHLVSLGHGNSNNETKAGPMVPMVKTPTDYHTLLWYKVTTMFPFIRGSRAPYYPHALVWCTYLST